MRVKSEKSELVFTSGVLCCLQTWGIPYLDSIMQLPISVLKDGLNHLNQIKTYLRNLIFIRYGLSKYNKNGINLLNCDIFRSTDFRVCIEESKTDFGSNLYELIMRRNEQKNSDLHTRCGEFRISVCNVSTKSTVTNSKSPIFFSDKPTSSNSDTPRASSCKPSRSTSLSPLLSNSEQILNGDEHYRVILNSPRSHIKLIRQGNETK
jgi:hypothetical protein